MAERAGGSLFVRAIIAMAVVVGAPLLVAGFVFKPYSMPAASMEPNLQRGDYFWALKVPFFGAPKRGDIITFKLPSAPKVDFVKRLVGMPGDHVQMKGGRLFINDKPLPVVSLGAAEGDLPGGRQSLQLMRETAPEGRSYQIQVSPGFESAGDTGVYVVPSHCYFVLGDNRDNSLDSRFDPGVAPDDPKLHGCGWDEALDEKVGDEAGVGFVPEANLTGRAAFVVFSWNTGLDEEHPAGATVLNPLSWFTEARPSRFFRMLH